MLNSGGAMNKKGFVLTETLVVVVFLVTIFTFIYVSIIPLMGKYENLADTEENIDVVYKLHHIRRLINADSKRKDIIPSVGVTQIECGDLARTTFCHKLMEQMELRDEDADNDDGNYVIIYASSLDSNNLILINNISGEIGEYAEKNKDVITKRVLFLLDTKEHTLTHLYYDDLL